MCVKRLIFSFLLLAAPFLLRAQGMVTSGQSDGISKSVRYDVAKFTDTRDRKLQDVLDKLPGMSKWEWSGGTNYWYNGAWVQKIYINGKDILGGNYLPVYNLKPEDVESLEILENHVHVKVMNGVQYSDNATLNIILKPEASSGLSGSFKAEYILSDDWILQAAATNILDQETYNYTLVDSDTFSRSFTSYLIRPRNILLSIFHKF